MDRNPYQFYHCIHLKKITEDLPYRLTGVRKKEVKIIHSSSDSDDDFEDEFIPSEITDKDPKTIKKKYTFKKKNKIDISKKRPKTSEQIRERSDISKFFKEDNKPQQIKSVFFEDENLEKPKICYSNFNSLKSDGCKRIQLFFSEFDYESEEDKLKREHLESIHLNGRTLVPSSCKEIRVPPEFKSISSFAKQYTLLNRQDELDETCKEVENWKNYLNSDVFNEPENGKSQKAKKASDMLNEINQKTKDDMCNEKDLNSTDVPLKDSEEGAKFSKLIKNARLKGITIDSNLQEKVTKRVAIKKNNTAAVHLSSAVSRASPTVPIAWPSAKKSLVVTPRHEKKLHDYLEKRESPQMTKNEITTLGKTLRALEEKRRIANQNSKVPDWARCGLDLQPILMTAPKKTKVEVRSKAMKDKDYLF